MKLVPRGRTRRTRRTALRARRGRTLHRKLLLAACCVPLARRVPRWEQVLLQRARNVLQAPLPRSKVLEFARCAPKASSCQPQLGIAPTTVRHVQLAALRGPLAHPPALRVRPAPLLRQQGKQIAQRAHLGQSRATAQQHVSPAPLDSSLPTERTASTAVLGRTPPRVGPACAQTALWELFSVGSGPPRTVSAFLAPRASMLTPPAAASARCALLARRTTLQAKILSSIACPAPRGCTPTLQEVPAAQNARRERPFPPPAQQVLQHACPVAWEPTRSPEVQHALTVQLARFGTRQGAARWPAALPARRERFRTLWGVIHAQLAPVDMFQWPLGPPRALRATRASTNCPERPARHVHVGTLPAKLQPQRALRAQRGLPSTTRDRTQWHTAARAHVEATTTHRDKPPALPAQPARPSAFRAPPRPRSASLATPDTSRPWPGRNLVSLVPQEATPRLERKRVLCANAGLTRRPRAPLVPPAPPDPPATQRVQLRRRLARPASRGRTPQQRDRLSAWHAPRGPQALPLRQRRRPHAKPVPLGRTRRTRAACRVPSARLELTATTPAPAPPPNAFHAQRAPRTPTKASRCASFVNLDLFPRGGRSLAPHALRAPRRRRRDRTLVSRVLVAPTLRHQAAPIAFRAQRALSAT